MVDHFEIRCTSPSIAFPFAHLGGLLDSSSDPLGVLSHCSSDQYPQIGDFVVGDSGLDLALGNLNPLLHQSLSWFKFVRRVFRRENIGSEVRSSDPKRGLSSNVGADGAGTNTATFVPTFVPSSSLPPASTTLCSFHALKEECTSKADVFVKFRDRF